MWKISCLCKCSCRRSFLCRCSSGRYPFRCRCTCGRSPLWAGVGVEDFLSVQLCVWEISSLCRCSDGRSTLFCAGVRNGELLCVPVPCGRSPICASVLVGDRHLSVQVLVSEIAPFCAVVRMEDLLSVQVFVWKSPFCPGAPVGDLLSVQVHVWLISLLCRCTCG